MHTVDQPPATKASDNRFARCVFWGLLGLACLWFTGHLGAFRLKADHAGEVTITNPQPGDVELVKAAMRVFEANCPDLFGRYRADIQKITATVDRDPGLWFEDEGWT